MNIGKTIKQIREDKKMSQEEFAQMFYVTRQTVSNWENEKSYPDLQTLVNISDIFNVSLDRLIKEDTAMIKSFTNLSKGNSRVKKAQKHLFTAVLILIALAILMFLTYIFNYYISKNKIESKFKNGINNYGFQMSQSGCYLLNADENVTYEIPNQKMPPLLDFATDFHAKFLDAKMKTADGYINIRWSDDSIVSVSLEANDGNTYFANAEFKDKSLNAADSSDNKLKNIFSKYNNDLNSIYTNGNEIYNRIYKT